MATVTIIACSKNMTISIIQLKTEGPIASSPLLLKATETGWETARPDMQSPGVMWNEVPGVTCSPVIVIMGQSTRI